MIWKILVFRKKVFFDGFEVNNEFLIYLDNIRVFIGKVDDLYVGIYFYLLEMNR